MKKKIIVLGDIMIDRFYYGKMERISPEGPFPIINISNIQDELGGVGNLVLNLKNLLPNFSIHLLSIIGNDDNGNKIKELIKEYNIENDILVDESRITNVKNRIICQNVMTSRFDTESTEYTDIIYYNYFVGKIEDLIKRQEVQIIVISDFDKGFITEYFYGRIQSICDEYQIPIYLDPKHNSFLKFNKCYLLKTNIKQALFITKKNDINEILSDLFHRYNCHFILLILDSEGLILYSHPNKYEYYHNNIKVKNIIGCDNNIFATFISEFLKNNNFLYSAEIANYIGGLSLKNEGIFICNQEHIQEYYQINNIKNNLLEKVKIYNYNKNNIIFQHLLKTLKLYKNIIFSYGSFDIIHLAHIKFLKHCKSLGDINIIGLYADDNTNKYINNENDRSQLLSELSFVDCIIIFKKDKLNEVIHNIQPHSIVIHQNQIIQNILSNEYHDKIVLFEFMENYSSNNIIQKIKSL